ncbi:MAG: VOC family protein [Gammaproteobacteria bacterium]
MVKKLDHVNIATTRIDDTVRFYTEVIGLRSGPLPGMPAGMKFSGAWLYDETDCPVVHLIGVDAAAADATLAMMRERRARPDFELAGLEGSGALDHIAFECEDYDAMRGKLADRALAHRLNEVASIGLKQIFVNDPNGITLELNFRAPPRP